MVGRNGRLTFLFKKNYTTPVVLKKAFTKLVIFHIVMNDKCPISRRGERVRLEPPEIMLRFERSRIFLYSDAVVTSRNTFLKTMTFLFKLSILLFVCLFNFLFFFNVASSTQLKFL